MVVVIVVVEDFGLFCMQIHVTPSGTSNMLFNTEKLQGMPKKIKALARREAEVSMVQQVLPFLLFCPHACIDDADANHQYHQQQQQHPHYQYL